MSPHTQHGRVREQVVLRQHQHLRRCEAREVGAERSRWWAADAVRDHVEHRSGPRAPAAPARRHVVGPHAPALGLEERVPHHLVGDVAPEARARHAVLLVRHAVVVPEALRGVDVVHRAEHLGVDPLHVVRLAEAVGDRPSSCSRPWCASTAAQRNSSRPAHAVSSGMPSRYSSERHRVGVEVDEHERAPRADLTGNSGKSSLTSPPNHLRDGTSRSWPRRSQVQRWHGQRISVRPVAAALADRVAAVAAHVLERAQLAVVAAHDQHRVAGRRGTRSSRRARPRGRRCTRSATRSATVAPPRARRNRATGSGPPAMRTALPGAFQTIVSLARSVMSPTARACRDGRRCRDRRAGWPRRSRSWRR